MKILFLHQNFPGQYKHLARHLGAMPDNQVVFITQREDASLPGVGKIVYKPGRRVADGLHPYLHETEAGIVNAQHVARIALQLREKGFIPDVVLGHNGWGEPWYVKEVWPDVPLIGYFEFFFRLHGTDVGFEPGAHVDFDAGPRLRTRNVGNLLGLEAVDVGQCPTQWQKSLYPAEYQSKLHLVHDGIDTDMVRPDPFVRVALDDAGVELTTADEVVTYVSRHLEPLRGFPSFMRSLPKILAERPRAHVIVVGGDGVSYGPRAPDGKSFREMMLAELGDTIDTSRVHFLGQVPYSWFVWILQVSSVHVYLTSPFVLSWSMLEAMSAGCLVVASSTAPVQEVIRDGENGLLVDMFSPAQIAERVIEALADRPRFEPLRAAARRTIVENYDLRRICLPAQLKLLETAMSSRAAKA